MSFPARRSNAATRAASRPPARRGQLLDPGSHFLRLCRHPSDHRYASARMASCMFVGDDDYRDLTPHDRIADMPNEGQTPPLELQALLENYTRALAESTRAKADAGDKVIQAVRELLAFFSMIDEGPSPQGVSNNRNAIPTATDLMQHPSSTSMTQALNMLTATIRRLGSETGISEEEILEELAAGFLELRSTGASVIDNVTHDIHKD